MPSGIAKWFCRHVSQDVCPYNSKFAKELSEPAFAARAALAGMDARSLSRSLLSMSQAEFSTAFKGSPMKRAKRRGLRRNASVVLGNAGSADDVPALVEALSDKEPLVHGHAAWALGKIGASAAVEPSRERLSSEDDPAVAGELRSALAALGGARRLTATVREVLGRVRRRAQRDDRAEALPHVLARLREALGALQLLTCGLDLPPHDVKLPQARVVVEALLARVLPQWRPARAHGAGRPVAAARARARARAPPMRPRAALRP